MILVGGPFGLGAPELLIILVVILLLFGASRLGDVGGSLGRGIKEFRQNIKDDEKKPDAAAPAAAPTTPSASAGGDVVAARKCPSCGALNAVSAKHCNECGASMAAPVS